MRRPSSPRGTLSVCCLTRGPTARVAAQLELLREVADEIVVGLDTSVDATLAHPLVEVADVVVHYPYVDPVDRPVGWIHSLCTQDWILWVDDDEIPSAGLVEALAELVSDVTVTHCFVPRRTLWRDAATVLRGPPWVPDFQLRLVLNDPRLVWFPGITHWPIQAIGPHRYLDAPLYHTDLLLNPEERRRDKVRRYEAAIPGRRVTGLPMNDAYFLPEDRPSVGVAPVPSPDRETLARILALEPSPEPRPLSTPLRVASRSEIDAHWHGAPATEALYDGRLEVLAGVEPFAAGEERGVVVRVENRSTHTWPQAGVGFPAIAVACRWLDEEGETVVGEGLRTRLPAALPPGGSLDLPVDVRAPAVAGSHVLVLDLLQEHVRWFGCEVRQQVEIEPVLALALLGDTTETAHRAAAALAAVAPDVRPIVLSPSPAETTELHGYEAGVDVRAYVLGEGRRGVRGTAGTLGRAGALVTDAALGRLGRRPRVAAPRGAAYLDALTEADALLVVGDATLRGANGRREALQQLSAVLAASTLGLRIAVVSTSDDDGLVAGRMLDTVRVGEAGFEAAVSEAVARLRTRAA